MSATPPALPDLETLLKEGAAAVAANLTIIATQETKIASQQAELEQLRLANAALRSKESSVNFTVSTEEATKIANVLLGQQMIAPSDRDGAIASMVREPKRVLGVLEKLAAKLPAPFAMPGGADVPKGQNQFGGAPEPKTERWY